MEADAARPKTVGSLLAQRATRDAREPLLLFEDAGGRIVERSYGDMEERAARVAGVLRARGVARKDAVHVHLTNRPEFYDCWFAAAKLGAVIVPTNPSYTPAELSYVIEHAGCKISVTQQDLAPAVSAARSDDATVLAVGPEFESEIRRRTPEYELRAAESDIAAILYTSGTTSRPKGVLVTHRNYLHVGNILARHLELQAGDRVLVALPLFHANAQYYCTLPALVAGASIALIERFSASQWGRQATRFKATVASLFAAPIRMILAHPARPDDSANRLRVVLFSQNLAARQLAEFEGRFGAPLLQLYGMTETIAPPVMNPLRGERRNLGIGLPVGGTQIRIVGDDGDEVEPGEVGELLVAGEPGISLTAGYLADRASTAAAIQDGWLRTGDAVRTDAQGYLYFVDRRKDMIKRAGENVSAGEIEAVVNDHPDVFECAAVGVPDPMRDEAIRLFVVPAPGRSPSQEELLAWCGERLAPFKMPSFVEVVDSLPRTSVGKIKKEILRQLGPRPRGRDISDE